MTNKTQNWKHIAKGLALAVLLSVAGGGTPAPAIDEIRSYLEVRDAAAALKAELQRAVSGATDSVLLTNPRGEQEVSEIFSWLEGQAERFRTQNTPLSVYYNDRLSRMLEECRSLYPHFVKRRALGVRTEVRQVLVPPPPVQPRPEPAAPQQPERELVIAHTPAPRPKPAAAVMPAVSRPTSEMLARRRAFFHPIGVRTLVPSVPVPAVVPPSRPAPQVPVIPPAAPVVAAPVPVSPVAPVTAPAPATIAVMMPPVASAVVVAPVPPVQPAPASFPALPAPVAQAPAAFTPLEPWSGEDPQIRQTAGMRPLAIMIENHNQARPQTGMHEAELVYEIPVEGGITRFMALYYHVPAAVGPVRSCREYFVDRALEVNALYVHCGGSPNGYRYIGEQKVFAIDEISNGTPFFRDNSRKAPHNLYAKPQKVIEVMNQRHPMELPYQRLPLLYGPAPSVGTIPCRGIAIRYHGNYTASYKMNARTGRYDRYMNGTQQVDRVTLQPVAPGTVLLQLANMRVIDDKGRQEISFLGEGRGLVLYGGTARPVTWKKTAPREFTRFYDETGKPFVFSNKSPVWVQVISPANRVAFDPPLPQTMVAYLGLNPPIPAKPASQAAKASSRKASKATPAASASQTRNL
ncbi:MAG TPA: DUF3048 domain-containing protein [Candidatus Ozemobacteraceae bacterium]|nr:DUF3048 domain-containing protein [Candidatus Ozemobacteraceae bacterium]